MPTSEGIDYEAVLDDLKARRDQLNVAIAGIEQMLGLAASSPAGATPSVTDEQLPKQVETDTFFGLSAVEAAKKYLKIVKRPAAMKTIHDALKDGGYLTHSKNFYANLYTAIMRSPDFVKVKKNWGLAEWYGGRRPPVEEKTATKKRKKGRKAQPHPVRSSKAKKGESEQPAQNEESAGESANAA